MDCSTPGFPVFHYLLKFAKIHVHESVMLPNHLILCRPLLLPSIFPSIRVFSRESTLRIRWPKHWSFSNSSSNEYSGLISFKIYWFDILAVQGTLKSSPAQFKSISSSRLSLLYGCQPGSGKRSSHLQVKRPRKGLRVVLYSQPSNSPLQRMEVPRLSGRAPPFVSTYQRVRLRLFRVTENA